MLRIVLLVSQLKVFAEQIFAQFEKPLKAVIQRLRQFVDQVKDPLLDFFKQLTSEQKESAIQ